MKKNIKRIDLIFLIIILLVLFGGFIKPIIKQNSINYYENRPSISFKNPTINTILDGSFQDNVEDTYEDQIPLYSYFKKGYNLLTNYVTLYINKSIYKNYPNRYMPLNNLLIYNDNIVYYYRNLNDEKEKLDLKINNYNDYFNKFSNLDFYVYYIEKDTDIDFENNEKMGIYDYLKKGFRLDENNISRLKIDSFEDYENYFYKTDHHWNYKGSYQGYSDIIEMMTNEQKMEIVEERCLGLKFSGSKASSAGVTKIMYDNFCAYKFDYLDHTTSIEGNSIEYGNEDKYFNNELSSVTYGDFYGGDDSIVIFNYNNRDKENILILGESYDNAIIKLIASHFNKTYSVDLRNYKDKQFNFRDFVEENGITKVLLVGNIDFFTMEEFMLKG